MRRTEAFLFEWLASAVRPRLLSDSDKRSGNTSLIQARLLVNHGRGLLKSHVVPFLTTQVPGGQTIIQKSLRLFPAW